MVAIAAILSWNYGYYTPRARTEKMLQQPMLDLEKEISALQIISSQQLAELNERATVVSHLLVNNAQDLPALLEELKTTIGKSGWDATFQVSDTSDRPASTEPLQIAFLPVRAKFRPQASNQDRFSSLVAVLEQLSSSGKRIDLTRVTIRADDSRWQPVEVNLRLICPVSHEKTLK